MADLGELPNGVIMEILLRVAPESLIRFKCVSKSWYALINDPKFGASLHNRNNVLLRRIVTNNETAKEEIRFSFLKYPLAFTADDEVEDVHFPFFGEGFRYTHINGHSHGLVCLRGPKFILLYNPATRELRKLPPSILQLPKDFDPYEDSIDDDIVGFGYDPKSKDFKVISVVGYFLPRRSLLPLSRAEVYDLEKGEWREIETPFLGDLWEEQMYYQGFYYWLAQYDTSDSQGEIIMSFDMSEEVFTPIPMPESFRMDDGNYRCMRVLNGSIVMCHYPWEGDEKSFDVWKMIKVGDVVSWSKLFTIGPLYGIRSPLTFVGSDQVLMDTNEGRVIWYDIKTHHLKHLSLEGHLDEFQATTFVNTLLSVNGGH